MFSYPVLLSELIRCVLSPVENARNRIALCILLLQTKLTLFYCNAQFRVTQKNQPAELQPPPTPTPCYLSYSQISQQGPRILPSDIRTEFSPKKIATDFSIFFRIWSSLEWGLLRRHVQGVQLKSGPLTKP